jgi:predicted DNA-binding protein with PD1-like motif
MQTLPLRLTPGSDLRRALEIAIGAQGCTAAFVLAGIGSLSKTQLRLAGARTPIQLDDDIEVLSLSGSVSAAASHLHMSIADTKGRVLGGHVAYGCVVRTTAEVLVCLLPEWDFHRAPDAVTGYDELVIAPTDPSKDRPSKLCGVGASP